MSKGPSLKILTVILIAIAATSCDSPSSQIPASISTVAIPSSRLCMWEEIATRSDFKTHSQNPRVQYFIKQFTRSKAQNLINHSKQAVPYLYHIVKQLEERGLPVELALLPIIESEYRPSATSKKGAVGLWQISAVTGRYLGLKQDQWYDGRKDIDAATNAALDHIEYLYEQFNHDWLLVLAAYNAGNGRIEQAIRNNKRAGKPTDYWSLSLPKETQYYVPKFLALVHLIKHSKNYGIDLEYVPNKPYFTQVELEKQMDLHKAANLAELDLKEVKRLNPEYRANKTHPKGPHKILLPVKNASIFKANLRVSEKKQVTAKKS